MNNKQRFKLSGRLCWKKRQAASQHKGYSFLEGKVDKYQLAEKGSAKWRNGEKVGKADRKREKYILFCSTFPIFCADQEKKLVYG